MPLLNCWKGLSGVIGLGHPALKDALRLPSWTLKSRVGPSLKKGMLPLPSVLFLDSHIRHSNEKRDEEEKKILFSLDLCFHLLYVLGAIRQKGKSGS